MTAEDRKKVIKKFFLPLFLIVLFYTFLTAFRDFRDNFARELWDSIGYQGDVSVFSTSEIIIAIVVLLIIGSIFYIKDNFKALLPIVAVSKGWGLYGGLVEFNFKPHEDYPHKEPYTKKSDANDNHHRITVVDEINKDITAVRDEVNTRRKFGWVIIVLLVFMAGIIWMYRKSLPDEE